MGKSLMEVFSVMPDPRMARTQKHKLVDIMVITVCAVLSGCDNWVDIADYGEEKQDWFKTFLELPNGIASHDTFGRVFSILDFKSFEQAFFEWLNEFKEQKEFRLVHIDGKFVNGSRAEPANSRSCLTLVNAWASEAGLFLGQSISHLKKEEGERRATESLIEKLFLKGCIVTLDAFGATPRIVTKIIEKNADYLIGLKANQRSLLRYATASFEGRKSKLSEFETNEKDHGRIEQRSYKLIRFNKAQVPPGFEKGFEEIKEKWPNLSQFIQVTRTRTVREKTSVETSYYMTSLTKSSAKKMAEIVRAHWTVENQLHWMLDVVFGEDHNQVRIGQAAENLGLLRRWALNLLRNNQDKKSIRRKFNKCSWNNDYMLKTLTSATSF